MKLSRFSFVLATLLLACNQQSVVIQNISEKYLLEHSHLETTLVVNPTNPNNIIVASMISDGGYTIEYSVIYYSTDQGKTWSQGMNMESNALEFPDGDPYLAADSRGNFYITNLQNGITVWRSADEGKSWSYLSTVPGSKVYDREWIVADVNDP